MQILWHILSGSKSFGTLKSILAEDLPMSDEIDKERLLKTSQFVT